MARKPQKRVQEIMLGEGFAEFLTSIEGRNRSTVRGYRDSLRRFEESAGKVGARKVDSQQREQWGDELVAANAKRKEITIHFSRVRCAFEYLKEQGYVDVNPFKNEPIGISVREFARRAGVSVGVIERAIAAQPPRLIPIDDSIGTRYRHYRLREDDVEPFKAEQAKLKKATIAKGVFRTDQGEAYSIPTASRKGKVGLGLLRIALDRTCLLPEGYLRSYYWPSMMPVPRKAATSKNAGATSTDEQSQKKPTRSGINTRVILKTDLARLIKARDSALKRDAELQKAGWRSMVELVRELKVGDKFAAAQNVSICVRCWASLGFIKQETTIRALEIAVPATWTGSSRGSRQVRGKKKARAFHKLTVYRIEEVRKQFARDWIAIGRPVLLELFEKRKTVPVTEIKSRLAEVGVVGQSLKQLLEACNAVIVNSRPLGRKGKGKKTPNSYRLATAPVKKRRPPVAASVVLKWFRKVMERPMADREGWRIIEEAEKKGYKFGRLRTARRRLRVRSVFTGFGENLVAYWLLESETLRDELKRARHAVNTASGKNSSGRGREPRNWESRKPDLRLVEDWEAYRRECEALSPPIRPETFKFAEQRGEASGGEVIAERVNRHYTWENTMLREWEAAKKTNARAFIQTRCPGMSSDEFQRVIRRAMERRETRKKRSQKLVNSNRAT